MPTLSTTRLSISPWIIAQGVGFQLFWFSCVLGQNNWLFLSVPLLASHFIFSPQRARDFKILSLAIIGISIDFALTLSGFFIFSTPPFWLALLWLGFIISLDHSLQWLAKLPPYIQALFGGIAGCLSYLTGEKFSAVDFGFSYSTSVVILLCIWCVLMPTLYKLLRLIPRKI